MLRSVMPLRILGVVPSTQRDAQFHADVSLVNVTCSVRAADRRFIAQLDRNASGRESKFMERPRLLRGQLRSSGPKRIRLMGYKGESLLYSAAELGRGTDE